MENIHILGTVYHVNEMNTQKKNDDIIPWLSTSLSWTKWEKKYTNNYSTVIEIQIEVPITFQWNKK